jgi:hypothetical protein
MLYWTIDFPSKTNFLQKQLQKSERTTMEYLKIFESLNVHLIVNLICISKIRCVPLTLNGMIMAILHFAIQFIVVLYFYGKNRRKGTYLTDQMFKLKQKSDRSINIVKFNEQLGDFRMYFHKTMMRDSSSQTYEDMMENYGESYVPLREIIDSKSDLTREQINQFLIPGTRDKLISMCGVHPYPFMRAKVGDNSMLGFLKNPINYSPFVSIIVIYYASSFVQQNFLF